MTRIIAGRAGGIRLEVPAAGTRPTSDRVRESLFAALESADLIADARVLDLYAGSGALGLEALSRGAAAAALVESSSAAATVSRRNATRVAASMRAAAALVHRASVASFLASTRSGPFDLVFADPPYDVPDEDVSAMLRALAPHLAAGATVILERGARADAPAAVTGLSIARSRTYGDTALWWLRADHVAD